MTSQTVSLQPFPGTSDAPEIAFESIIKRTSDNQLSIIYDLKGEVDQIQFAEDTETPSRQWDLWETTCFELFVGTIGEKNYWELNLAPNGNWNVFNLDDYRQGICETKSIEQLKIVTGGKANQFTLATEVSLDSLIAPETPIEVSITAIIQATSGAISYWANKHSAAEPDFHQRDSFMIKL